jgi:hypothetical protein
VSVCTYLLTITLGLMMIFLCYFNKVKVKLSLYRPWRPLGLREVEAPAFSDIRLIDGCKVVSPTRRPLFTPRKISGTHFYSWYSFILEAESTLGS